MSESGGTGRAIPEGLVLRQEVGRGGYSRVFLAEQGALNRHVALKLLTIQLDDDEAERRFRNECRAVGSLSWHRHVVTVHDAGITAGGEPYLLMEYLPGGSLQERLRSRGPLPWREAAVAGAQVASALAAAHEAGVLHRDMKPANVMIDRSGDHRLGDFGIARFASGTATQAGAIRGTLAYAPPEMLGGGSPGPASDLYGLGATLYALLTGRPPFGQAGDDMPAIAVLHRIATEAPPPLPATLPRPLADLVGRLLAKDPTDRPSSAAAVAGELARIGVIPDPVAAAGPIAPTRPLEAPPPTPAVARPVAAPPGPPSPPTAAYPAATGGYHPGPPASPSSSGGRRRGRTVALVGAGLVLVIVAVVVAVVLSRDEGELEVTSIDLGDPITAVAVGDGVVWASQDDEVTAVDARTSEILARIRMEDVPGAVAVGPDDVWVAVPSRDQVMRIDPNERRITETLDLSSSPTQVSPDLLAFGAGGLWVAEAFEPTLIRLGDGVSPARAIIPDDGSANELAGSDDRLLIAADGDLRSIDSDAPERVAAEAGIGDAIIIDVAVDGDVVWIVAADRVVERSGGGDRSYTVPERPVAFAVADGSGFAVVGDDSPALRRVDDGTTIALPDQPADVVAEGKRLWVTHGGDRQSQLTRVQLP